MTKSEIITKAQLYLDDTSELSTKEFSDLFDKVYRMLNRQRPWEGTKTEYSGIQSTSTPTVSLPSDFLYLTKNADDKTVIYIGDTSDQYEVVSFSDRRQYRDASNIAYIDIKNSNLVFTKQPTSAKSIEYDYHTQMPALGDSDSPWFPDDFHDVIYHFMVADDMLIQQSSKSKSYRPENLREADKILVDMYYWNSQLIQL